MTEKQWEAEFDAHSGLYARAVAAIGCGFASVSGCETEFFEAVKRRLGSVKMRLQPEDCLITVGNGLKSSVKRSRQWFARTEKERQESKADAARSRQRIGLARHRKTLNIKAAVRIGELIANGEYTPRSRPGESLPSRDVS